MARKPFSKKLTQPIYSNDWWMTELYGESDPEGVAEYSAMDRKIIAEEMEEKLSLLLEHFDIPRDARDKWKRLSLGLAKRFISGFEVIPSKFERKAGSPRVWSPELLVRLYVEVQLIARTGRTARNACNLLLREERWRALGCGTLDTIYRRYQESKKSPYVIAMFEGKSDSTDWQRSADAVFREVDEYGQRKPVRKPKGDYFGTT